MQEYVTDGHLGGYVKGGDEATWFPQLWRWFVREQGVTSVLDVGCGEGHALNWFRDEGCDVRGVEGIEQPDPDITTHDFTEGPFNATVAAQKGMTLFGDVFVDIDYDFDLVWCCEFVEHVKEQYVPNFLETFKLGRIVAMTHATPGQQGYHHVNCQPASYWIYALEEIGFRYDRLLASEARRIAAKNPSPWNHFVRSGMVFVRERDVLGCG